MRLIQDTLTGGNFLIGTTEDDLILGLDGNDRLEGREGADVLQGGLNNDTLIGGNGDDVLWGNEGFDILEGGAGKDTFIVQALPDGKKIIVDFEDGIDRIGLIDEISGIPIAFNDLEIVQPPNSASTIVRVRSTQQELVEVIPRRDSNRQIVWDVSDFTRVDILEFSQPRFQLREDGTVVSAVTVTRKIPSGRAVSAKIRLINGTAIGQTTGVNFDFFPNDISVNFEPQEVSKTVEILINNDSIVENLESFQAQLENPTGGATIGAQNLAAIDIIDNDLTVGFSRANFTTLESGTPVVAVTLVRSGLSDREAGVVVVPSNGTATANDYNATPIAVRFAPGETVKTINIPITDDLQPEENETINLTLQDPGPGVTIAPQGTATLTILDNDVALQFSQPIFRVNENGSSTIQGSTGTVEAIARVEVIRVGATNSVASATITLTDSSATAPADYNNTPIPVTFNVGETRKTIDIPIVNDITPESLETLNLTLVNPIPGVTIGQQRVAVLEIADDDLVLPPPPPPPPPPQPEDPGQLQFSAANFLTNEDGNTIAKVSVTRTNGSAGAVSATLFLNNGTALSGLDYIDTPITVNFADGETVKEIDISILDDREIEVAETINLTLLDPTNGASLGDRKTATLTIARSDMGETGGLLDFEGVGNLKSVDRFYGDRGVRFSQNGLGIIGVCPLVKDKTKDEFGGNFDRTPSGQTALTYKEGDDIILDVSGGFDGQLSFSYASPFRKHAVKIYDGVGGTGNVLASIDLPQTQKGKFPSAYSNFSTQTLLFSGTAKSIAFGDFANKLVVDDIILG